jgi:UDP-N-acetylglucosamine acyltransferase
MACPEMGKAAMAIHPTAIVEDGARLGAGVEIGPFCVVSASAVLGEGVRLISHVVIVGHAELGARTVVHPSAVLGGAAQIRGNKYAEGRLVIGADCELREGVTMSVGSEKGGGLTQIGDRGYFMAMSHVAHDCDIGANVTFTNGAVAGGHVEIGDGVIMGGNSAVQQFGRVGKGAFVGGMTGVNTDVIPYGQAIGDHAVLGGLNLIGLKRRGLPRATIHAMRGAFRMIFREEGGSVFDRAAHAKAHWPNVAEVQEIADFILADAKRPICMARKRAGRTDDEE